MYAEFLSEAAALLEAPELADAARQVAHTGTLWTDLAHFMLDGTDPVLARCKAMVDAGGWPRGPDHLTAFAALADDWPPERHTDFHTQLATRLEALLAAERQTRDALAG